MRPPGETVTRDDVLSISIDAGHQDSRGRSRDCATSFKSLQSFLGRRQVTKAGRIETKHPTEALIVPPLKRSLEQSPHLADNF